MNKTIAKILSILCLVIFFAGLFLFGLFSRYPQKFKEQIKTASAKYNLDSALVASVINTESAFDLNAKSKKGAIGLMQILPSTASWICQYSDIDYQNEQDLFDPQKNILIGCRYLQYLFEKFEDQTCALCAYNAGEGVVKNWLSNKEYSSDFKTLKSIPYAETKNYIKKISNNLKVYKVLY